jgi:hypothetical protein
MHSPKIAPIEFYLMCCYSCLYLSRLQMGACGILLSAIPIPGQRGLAQKRSLMDDRRLIKDRDEGAPRWRHLHGSSSRTSPPGSMIASTVFILIDTVTPPAASATDNSGERVRLARRVWRPAKHIPPWLRLEGSPIPRIIHGEEPAKKRGAGRAPPRAGRSRSPILAACAGIHGNRRKSIFDLFGGGKDV